MGPLDKRKRSGNLGVAVRSVKSSKRSLQFGRKGKRGGRAMTLHKVKPQRPQHCNEGDEEDVEGASQLEEEDGSSIEEKTTEVQQGAVSESGEGIDGDEEEEEEEEEEEGAEDNEEEEEEEEDGEEDEEEDEEGDEEEDEYEDEEGDEEEDEEEEKPSRSTNLRTVSGGASRDRKTALKSLAKEERSRKRKVIKKVLKRADKEEEEHVCNAKEDVEAMKELKRKLHGKREADKVHMRAAWDKKIPTLRSDLSDPRKSNAFMNREQHDEIFNFIKGRLEAEENYNVMLKASLRKLWYASLAAACIKMIL